MQVINDNYCAWIHDLHPRNQICQLKNNENCDWLIVGSGYTGLSAARKLSQLHRKKK